MKYDYNPSWLINAKESLTPTIKYPPCETWFSIGSNSSWLGSSSLSYDPPLGSSMTSPVSMTSPPRRKPLWTPPTLSAGERPHGRARNLAMPKRLVAKPMPRPGDTSSSAGHTGARPKAKSRPSQRGEAPHWVIPALPIGFIEKTAENKDYPCGSNVRTRYWMERDGEMSCYRLGRGQLATPQTSTLGSNTWGE